MEQFIRDRFIDRYSGQKFVSLGILKVLPHYEPQTFPYHAHWKMEEHHNSIKSNWTLKWLERKLYDADKKATIDLLNVDPKEIKIIQ